MPDIPLKSQALDLAFHPQKDVLFAALLDGQIRCYSYDAEGAVTLKWKVRLSKKSCRALDIRSDGLHLWVGTKSGCIYTIETETGKVLGERPYAHGSAISRITTLGETMNMFASGDDDGGVKLWDTRSPSDPNALRIYNHHTDYISDLAWLSSKKHLVATSGDGTLSVIDVRSNKTKPFAQSEDQEDELLSVIPIKGGAKIVVGTQLGPLTIFDRTKGYADCVDRFLGHPTSVETMVSLSTSQITQDVIATGSSDGLIRVVQIHPSKFLGVIAAHGSSSAEQDREGADQHSASNTEGLPIERMKLDRHKKWLGSISHDEILKLTDIEGALEGDSDESDEQVDEANLVNNGQVQGEDWAGTDEQRNDGSDENNHKDTVETVDEGDEILHATAKIPEAAIGQESDSEASVPATYSDLKQSKKRRKKELRREERSKRNKGDSTSNFFADL